MFPGKFGHVFSISSILPSFSVLVIETWMGPIQTQYKNIVDVPTVSFHDYSSLYPDYEMLGKKPTSVSQTFINTPTIPTVTMHFFPPKTIYVSLIEKLNDYCSHPFDGESTIKQ